MDKYDRSILKAFGCGSTIWLTMLVLGTVGGLCSLALSVAVIVWVLQAMGVIS